jgi:EpsI family protein
MTLSIKNFVLLALMLASAALAAAMRPTVSLADERTPINLKAMVPHAFGDWQEQIDQSNQVVNPQQKQMLDTLYSETLSRTYVNRAGYRIMLSIAYGKNQSDALQLHKPEICYPAQGFRLLAKQAGTLDLLGRPITAIRLATDLGLRVEPITYWTVVGDHVTKSGIDKKLTEMRYAVRGKIPDGMLVRVSSIDKDTDSAHAIQNQFAAQMVNAIAPEHRMRFAGDPKVN